MGICWKARRRASRCARRLFREGGLGSNGERGLAAYLRNLLLAAVLWPGVVLAQSRQATSEEQLINWYYAAVFGTLKAGCVIGPLFSAFGPDAVKDRLENSGAIIFMTSHEL